MSKLDELINTLCPDGVKKYKIKEICNVSIGEFVHKNKQNDNAPYPVFNGGISNTGFYDEYNNDGDMILISARGANAGFVNKIEGKYWAGNSCYTLDVLDRDNINWLFVYYSVKNNEKRLLGEQQRGSIPAISKKQIEEFEIAVPPLEVQCEIVHILDDFTVLSAELSAELSARKNQFSYYREQLIDSKINVTRLNEVVDIYLGLTHTPKYVEKGVKFISAQNTSKDYLDLENVKYISREEYNSITGNAKPKKGDILFTRVGSNLGHPVIVDTNEELCMFVSLGYLRVKDNNKVLNSYIKHWINTENFWSQVRKNVHGSAKINLNTGWLCRFEISIPSISEQKRIVNILDKFEKLCNDISKGLPAEIEARQKQYEYYRDKLLNFKELKVEN